MRIIESTVFDVRQSTAHRAVVRMIIMLTLAIGLIAWGIWLLPADFSMWFSLPGLERWDGWSFVGLVSIGLGTFSLIKEIIFAYRSRAASGEWYFRFADDHLTWDIPDHAHGHETGFLAKLSEIKKIEYRTIREYDEMDKREYWIHFREREPIQLQSYSGVSVSWLVAQICEAGVQYNETCIDK